MCAVPTFLRLPRIVGRHTYYLDMMLRPVRIESKRQKED